MVRPAVVFFGLALASGAGAQTLTPQDAMRQAYANRPGMKAGRQRLEEARRLASASSAYPATRLEAGKDIFNKTDVMGGADLLVFQPIDIFGKTRSLHEQANATIATALATYRQSALDIQGQVLTAYANLAAAQRLLDVANTQLQLASEASNLTDKRVAARDLPEIQSDRARLDVEKAMQLVGDRQSAVSAARLRLSSAVGSSDVDKMTLTAIELPSTPPDALKTLPELMSLTAAQAQAAADRRVANQAYFPDLEIQAGRDSFNDVAAYGARLQLTANLWDYGATRNKIRAADARRKAAANDLADKAASVQKEVEAAKLEWEAAQRSVEAYEKLAASARHLLERTNKGFELGASTLIDVLDARKALADAQELTVNAQLKRDLATEALLQAQGTLLEEPR